MSGLTVQKAGALARRISVKRLARSSYYAKEGAFDSANADEEEVCIYPLILGIGIRCSLTVTRLRDVKDVYILNSVCFRKHGGIDDIRCKQADHSQDHQTIIHH